MLHAAAALVAADARAQASSCDEFKAALAARIDATGARGYSLDTARAGSPVPPDAKVIGSCDSGATVILYRRWGTTRPSAAAAGPASAPPTRVSPAAPAQPRAGAPVDPASRPAAASAPGAAPRPVAQAKGAASAPATPGRGPEKPGVGVGEGVTARDVDRAVEQLAQIPLDFDPPAEMTLGEPVEIRLKPGSDKALGALRRVLGGGGAGDAPAAVARRLEAQLSGENFRITALTPMEMTLASTEPGLWQWQLHPTLAGTQTLRLSLGAEFLVDGMPARRAVRTIDRAIEVKLPLAQRPSGLASQYWQWLLGLLLVPAAIVAWGWYAHHRAYDAAGLPRGPRL